MNKLTKLFAAVIMTALILLTGCMNTSAAETGSDDGTMRKEMTSAEFAEEMGLGINLGNTMEAYWAAADRKCSGASVIGENRAVNYETCWGAVPTTKEAIEGMKKAGFDTVRIPVYWGNKMAEDGSFTINKFWFERVDEIIEYARSADMYVVRTCLHKKCVRIFEHNFVADKAKVRRRAVARQGVLTQYAAKFAEKTCTYACEDRF